MADYSASGYLTGHVAATLEWTGAPDRIPTKAYVRIDPEISARSCGPSGYAIATGARFLDESPVDGQTNARSYGPKYLEVAGGATINVPQLNLSASCGNDGGYSCFARALVNWTVLPQFKIEYVIGDDVATNFRKGASNTRLENVADKDGKIVVDVAMRANASGWNQIARVKANNPAYIGPIYDWFIPKTVTTYPGEPPSIYRTANGVGPLQESYADAGANPPEGESSEFMATVKDQADVEAPNQDNKLVVRWHFPYENWTVLRSVYVWDEAIVGFEPNYPQTCGKNGAAGGRYFANSLHSFQEEEWQNAFYVRIVRPALTDWIPWKGMGKLPYLLGLATPDSIQTKSHPFLVNFNDAWSDYSSTFEGGTRSDGMDFFRMVPRTMLRYTCKTYEADSYSASGYSGTGRHFFANYDGGMKHVGHFVFQSGNPNVPGGGTGGGPGTIGTGG